MCLMLELGTVELRKIELRNFYYCKITSNYFETDLQKYEDEKIKQRSESALSGEFGN